jgi:tetratricopeptide (TPR) repeat protein
LAGDRAAKPPCRHGTPAARLGYVSRGSESPGGLDIDRQHHRGPLSHAERRSYELGRRRYAQGDVDGAIDAFLEFLETRPTYADVHYMVGTLFERRNELDRAALSLREALRLNPSYVEALLALASLHERRGDYDGSQQLTERAGTVGRTSSAVVDPTTRAKLANLQAELADAYREAGELRDAIDGYRRSLARCPHFHDVRFRLATALRDSGRPDAALAEFERVIVANPGFLEAQVQHGVTLYSLGRAREAVIRWKDVLERDPDHKDACMYLRMVRREPSGASADGA